MLHDREYYAAEKRRLARIASDNVVARLTSQGLEVDDVEFVPIAVSEHLAKIRRSRRLEDARNERRERRRLESVI